MRIFNPLSAYSLTFRFYFVRLAPKYSTVKKQFLFSFSWMKELKTIGFSYSFIQHPYFTPQTATKVYHGTASATSDIRKIYLDYCPKDGAKQPACRNFYFVFRKTNVYLSLFLFRKTAHIKVSNCCACVNNVWLQIWWRYILFYLFISNKVRIYFECAIVSARPKLQKVELSWIIVTF